MPRGVPLDVRGSWHRNPCLPQPVPHRTFCLQLIKETEELEDGITGIKLKTSQQLMRINVNARGVKRKGYLKR